MHGLRRLHLRYVVRSISLVVFYFYLARLLYGKRIIVLYQDLFRALAHAKSTYSCRRGYSY